MISSTIRPILSVSFHFSQLPLFMHVLITQLDNQWPVNFNWSLSSFEPHIAGVRNLVDFTAQSQHNASIFFVSSIATVENNVSNKPVPEAPVTDLSCASMGYGSSKLAAELVLQAAGEQSKIVSSVCRVGQIAGPIGSERGQWNPKEWLPTVKRRCSQRIVH